jgi:spore photoproduct lyase
LKKVFSGASLSLPTVYQSETEGAAVRDCPGTRNHICCGYKNIDLIEGCPLSCSYCILRGYLNNPGIRIHANPTAIIGQLDDAINREKTHVLRFGTGELSDSLALDRRLGLNRPIVEYFGEKKKALFELKSKFAYIDHLRSSLNPFTVVSFSVAPQRSIEREEKRTSPLFKRLTTLRKAQELGCFVGLHFDPVIIYDGFESDYGYLIDDIARILDLRKVIWVSMGLLRFPPGLMDMFIRDRRQHLLHGEFIVGEDGKHRYLKQERIAVYKMLHDRLKEKDDGLFIYLCMERRDVWKKVTGNEVRHSDDLIQLFDRRIAELYGGFA